MAQDTRYLKKQRQGWYLCMTVPRGIRGRFTSEGRRGKNGRRHPGQPLSKITVSLRTQSLREAQERRWPLVHEWRQKFERARTGAPLALAEIDAVAREAYAAALAVMEANAKQRRPVNVLIAGGEAVQTGLSRAAVDTQSGSRQRRSRDAFVSGAAEFMRTEIDQCGGLEHFLAQVSDFDQYSLAPDIARIEARTGLTLDRGSETYRTLCQAILRARLTATEGRLRAANGEPSEPPATFLGAKGIDPVTLRPIAPLPRKPAKIKPAGAGMTFSEAAARYIDELQRDPAAKVSEQTRGQLEAVYRLFTQFADDPPLDAIDRATASEFLDRVGELDPHWGRSPNTKNLSWLELQARFGNGQAQLTNRTLNRYVSALSCVFKWAEKRGYFDGRNPFQGQSRRKADGTGWRAYKIDELNQLFAGPLFRDGPTQERLSPREHTAKTALYWAALIALFSGMRLGEICQLQTADVQRRGAIWLFNVRSEAKNQSLKTAAATRVVSVHSELIKCGFADYVKALPTGQLFPALKAGGPDGKLNWYLSKRFTDYRRTCGVADSRVAFHSFRKNAAQALKDASTTPAEIAELIGHERGFTVETYAPLQLPVPRLKSLIERIKYPGLRLKHLHVS